MDFQDVISLLVNNGIGIVCIIYFMLRDYKYMARLTDVISELNATLKLLKSQGGNNVSE